MKIIKPLAIAFVASLACTAAFAQHPVVTLDYYFNHEFKKNKTGEMVQYHYTWEDEASSGYSIWGKDFVSNGAEINALHGAPTMENLKGSDIYIIVDPDTKKETEQPNFIEQRDITQITAWVKQGGVLVLMANDSANVELPHLNNLAAKFGIHFNDDLYKHVIDKAFDMGAVSVPGDNAIFKTAKKVYLKDIATLTLTAPAKPMLTEDGHIIVGVARYGKGTVFAVGDPWFYNEYTNGRLPASFGFDNDKAANDLAKWLIAQVPAKK